MSKTQLEIPVKEKEAPNFIDHLGYGLAGTVAGHFFRVLQNRASLYRTPLEAIIGSYGMYSKGAFYNFLRGSITFGTQSSIKHKIQENDASNEYNEPVDTEIAKIIKIILGTSIAGSFISSFLETAHARKTTINDSLAPLLRFSPQLTTLYFAREIAFSSVMFAQQNRPVHEQIPSILLAAYITGAMQKAISFEVKRDVVPPGETGPNLKDGVWKTMQAMMHDRYTHKDFRAPIPNPVTRVDLIRNLMSVSCGVPSLVFRLAYLVTFKAAYLLAQEHIPPVSSGFGFFDKKRVMPSAENDLADEKANEYRYPEYW